jgi:hypothetical protein
LQLAKSDAVANDRPGFAGRVNQQRIEHGASRRQQKIDAMVRLYVHSNGLVAIVERGRSNRRRSRRRNIWSQSPAGELHNRRPHQGVRRHCIGAIGLPVDHQDLCPRPRQKEGRGSARTAGADNHRVII